MALATAKISWSSSLEGTANANTAYTVLIHPCRNGDPANRGESIIHTATLDSDIADIWTHVTCVFHRSGGTAHTIIAMRAKNWTTLGADMAAAATSITLAAGTGKGAGVGDPGLYSTNYNYPSPLAVSSTAAVADNAIAASDYVALQLKDGTWHVSTIASGTFGGSNLVLTTALPSPTTGGGASSGTRVYFFGVSTDKDPATGQLPPQFTMTATAGLYKDWSNVSEDPILSSIYPAQPILLYNANATNASFTQASFFYAKR